MPKHRFLRLLAVTAAIGLVTSGCGGGSKNATAHPNNAPSAFAAPLGVPHPVVTGPVLRAEQKLVGGGSRPLRLTADLTDPQLPDQAGTVITATGQVEWGKHLAEWSSVLPASYGGKTSVIYDGNAVYVRSADVQTEKNGSKWLLLTPATMSDLPRLGIMANLVVVFDPFVAIALQASAHASPAHISKSASVTGTAVNGETNAVLVDDSVPGCSGGSDSSGYESTLTPSQVADESDTDFRQFFAVMNIWSSVALQTELASDGDVYQIAMTAHFADGATQLSGGITFCSAAGAIRTLVTPSDDVTEALSFFILDPCLVGTWKLDTPVVEGIIAGPAAGTVVGLEGSTMQVTGNRNVTFDFEPGEPMTIDENPDNTAVLASAVVEWEGAIGTKIVNAGLSAAESGEHTGYVTWATTSDLLEEASGVISTLGGTQEVIIDPFGPPVPGAGPTLVYGDFSCRAHSLTMPIPVGSDDIATFTRVTTVDSAEFEKAMDDLNEALQKLSQLATVTDLLNEINEISVALEATSAALNNINVLPPITCRQIVTKRVELRVISAAVNKEDDKVSDVNSKLSDAEDKVTEQAGEVDDDAAAATVAAVKALETSADLTQKAATAIKAATQNILQAKDELAPLTQLATETDSNLKSLGSDLDQTAKVQHC